MRLLIFTQYFWPESFRINELAVSLARRGVTVTVLTGKPNYPDGNIFLGYRAAGCLEQNYEGIRTLRVPLFPRGRRSMWRLALNYLSFILAGCICGPWLLRGTRLEVILVYCPCMLVLRKIFQTWFQPRRLWAKGGAVDKSRGYSTYPRQATRFAGGIWPANCPQPPRPPVAGWQLDQPWGGRARGRARSAIPFSLFEPERLLGPVSPHFARMGHDREHL